MKFIPHPYQQFCIQQVIQKPAIGLFLDMGLGKTAITLTAVNELKYGRFQVRRILVIAPKKVAEATWQREAASAVLYCFGQYDEAHPGAEYAGRCVRHQPGERRLAGRLL